jgi:hypothetical protein
MMINITKHTKDKTMVLRNLIDGGYFIVDLPNIQTGNDVTTYRKLSTNSMNIIAVDANGATRVFSPITDIVEVQGFYSNQKKEKQICLDMREVRAAAKFIAKHNPNQFSEEYVFDSIIDTIKANINRNIALSGTMGYTVKFSEDDTIDIKVMVSPSLGKRSKYKTYKSIDELLSKAVKVRDNIDNRNILNRSLLNIRA